MAFPEGRRYAVEITIDHTLVGSDLTNKPIRVPKTALPDEMVDADGGKAALNGGGDILAYASDRSTRLSLEVVYFATDNTPANAEAELWIKVPTVSSAADTTIVLVWGKSGESQPARAAAYGREDVWSNGYYNVWHLGETSSSTADESTSQVNSGTYQGSLPTDVIQNGVRVQDADGTGDYVSVTAIDQAFSPGFTVETIVLFDDVSNTTDSVAWGRLTNGAFRVEASKWYLYFRGVVPYQGSITLSDNTWYHHALFRDNSDTFSGRTNGVADTGTGGVKNGNFDSMGTLGRSERGGVKELKGELDEVHVQDSDTGTAWTDVTHENTLNTSSFLSTSTVENLEGGGDCMPFFFHNMIT